MPSSPAKSTPAPLSLPDMARASAPDRDRSPVAVLAKRGYDLFFSTLGLALLSPLFLLVAAAIRLSDGGPVFYRQRRVGQYGRSFEILKFRSMVINADQHGPAVTRHGDARITRVGRLLRATKLDELPQLWNVFKGEMSFVGPRPEVPRYVEQYTSAQREILKLKPGITDLATLRFRKEEEMLGQAGQLEDFYVGCCLPRKIALNLDYARGANVLTDTWIIVQTIFPSWFGVLMLYALTLMASLWLSFWIRHEFSLSSHEWALFYQSVAWVIPLQCGLLLWRRQCVAVLGCLGWPDVRQIVIALGVALVAQLGIWSIAGGQGCPPRSIMLIDFALSCLALSALRLGFQLSSTSRKPRSGGSPARRVAIIGAGELGASLARQAALNYRQALSVVGFFDDDASKWRKRVHGIPVLGMPELLAQPAWASRFEEVLIAWPDAPPARLREIQALLDKAHVKSQTVLPFVTDRRNL